MARSELVLQGIAFITGGREVLHQHLDPHVTELNKSVRKAFLVSATLGSTISSLAAHAWVCSHYDHPFRVSSS